MNIKKLLFNIENIIKEKNISERKACINAGISPDFIRDMRRNGNFPKVDKLIKLANSLNISIDYFLNALNPKSSPPSLTLQNPFISLKIIYIKGNIEASQWIQKVEWPQSEWIIFPIPENPEFKNAKSFALNIRDESMNLLYPKGSIIIAVNFSDLERAPKDGECVVIIRYDKLTNCYEQTLKIVEIKENGKIFLWPYSNNPNFTHPIILPRSNSFHSKNNITPSVTIQSLVIGCYHNTIQRIKLQN